MDRSRWRLIDLLALCPWLRLTTPQSLSRLLARLGISYQRARDDIHSPDPDYDAKRAVVAAMREAAIADPARLVLLYLDEVTIGRQPTLAPAWEAVGPRQPLARRSERADTPTRVGGALDATNGRLHDRLGKVTIPALVGFFADLVAASPPGTRFAVVVDNWPVHFHPDLLVALEPQLSPFPRYLPANWPTAPSPAAVGRWGELALPIQLLPLPTYASWLNPIEKVWRKLRQELGHLHPFADDLPRLRAELDRWLAAHGPPSSDLLRYVGLASHD